MVRTFNYQRSKSLPPVSLLDFLTSSFKYHTKEQWSDIIKNKNWVSINKKLVTDPDTSLPHQCVIGFDVPAELEPEVDDRMELIYLDEHIGVVSKSGNLPVSEGGRYSKRTLVKIAAEKFLSNNNNKNEEEGDSSNNNNKNTNKTFTAVHRLDRETSGLVVMSRTHQATVDLGQQFARSGGADEEGSSSTVKESGKIRQRINKGENEDDDCIAETETEDNTTSNKVYKEYVAILQGELLEEKDIRLRIGNESELPPEEIKVPRKLTKMRMVCRDLSSTEKTDEKFGKEARTVVIPIKSDKKLTLCRVKLFTGRTHQIRIHCASIGHPLIGEKMYLSGGGAVDCDQYLRRVRGEEEVVHEILVRNDDNNKESNVKIIKLHPSRHLLHAAVLSFVHPVTRKMIKFESDYKKAFLESCPELKEFKLF